MKIRVGILDSDEIYLARLIRYFTTYYIDKVEISGFHDIEHFSEHLGTARIDVFLANPELIPAALEFPKTMIVAYLTDSRQAESVNQVKSVFKYQRAELLYREILGLYAELDRKIVYKPAGSSTVVLLFLGASGGVGTTTLAAACARRLASSTGRVLYLNLEENGVISPYFTGEGSMTWSDAIYAVKSGSSNLVLKLESMVRKSDTGVYFYEPCKITMDAHEMTESDLKELLDAITKFQAYDYIVVDGDSEILWKRNLLMKYAQSVFLVSGGGKIPVRKLERLIQEFAIHDEHEEERTLARVRILYNRCASLKKLPGNDMEIPYGVVEDFGMQPPDRVAEEIARQAVFDRLL